MTPRALLSLLYNGPKTVDVVRTALDTGVLATPESVFRWPPDDVAGFERSTRAGKGPVDAARAALLVEAAHGRRRAQKYVEQRIAAAVRSLPAPWR